MFVVILCQRVRCQELVFFKIIDCRDLEIERAAMPSSNLPVWWGDIIPSGGHLVKRGFSGNRVLWTCLYILWLLELLIVPDFQKHWAMAGAIVLHQGSTLKFNPPEVLNKLGPFPHPMSSIIQAPRCSQKQSSKRGVDITRWLFCVVFQNLWRSLTSLRRCKEFSSWVLSSLVLHTSMAFLRSRKAPHSKSKRKWTLGWRAILPINQGLFVRA